MLLATIGTCALLAPAAHAATTTYSYDALGRVTGAVSSDGQSVTYRYDAAGNRIQVVYATGFFQPKFRVVKPGLTGAAIGASSFDLPAASGLSALSSLPPNSSFSYEIDITTAGPDAGAVGVASQAWFDAGGQASTSIAGLAQWRVGQSTGYGEASGATATWNAAATTLSSGDVLGVTYSASTRKLRLYKNGAAIGTVTIAPALANVTLYPVLGGGAGVFKGAYRATPSNHHASYVIDPGAPNTRPNAAADTVTAFLNQAKTFDPRNNDADPEGDALRITAASPPAHGVVAVAGDGLSVTYTPATGYLGADGFAYTVTDGRGGYASAAVNLTIVTPPNTAPTAANDTIGATAGTARTFDPRDNDNDPDGDTLTVTAVGTPSHGTAVIGSGATSIVYTATAGYAGPDSFSYTIADGRGGSATATVNVTVTLAPVTWNPADKNANVVLSNGNLTASGPSQYGLVRATTSRSSGKYYYESTVSALGTSTGVGVATASAGTGNGAYVGADANAYGWYYNGQVYSSAAVTVTYPVTFATGDKIGVAVDLAANKVWWSKNGVWNGNPANGIGGQAIAAGTYFPAFSGYGGSSNTANFGATAFAATLPRGFAPWDASSGPAANHPPAAANDSASVEKNLAKVIIPQSNDTDADGDTLTITATSTPANGTISIASGGASVTYTPNTGFTGTDSFTYTVSDGAGGTGTATVNVTVALPIVTWSTTDKASNLTLSNGNLTGTQSQSSQHGMVRATSSRGSGKYYFEVTMTAMTHSGGVGVATGAASTAVNAYLGSDANGYSFYQTGAIYNGGAVVQSGYPTLAVGDIVGVAVDLDAHKVWWSKNGTWIGSPVTGVGGQTIASATIFPAMSAYNTGTALTGNFGATALYRQPPRGFSSWDGNVGPTPNAAPVAVNDTVQAERNVAKVISPQSNDTDADGDTLTITSTSTPANGTISIAAGGASVTYTPNTGYTGSDSFTYTVSDGAGGSATGTVSLTVVVTPVTWSATDRGPDIALSSGNLTAGRNNTSGDVWESVRSTAGRTTGKYYFEVTAGAANALTIGVMNSASSLNSAQGFPGGQSSSAGLVFLGAVYMNNASVASDSSWAISTGDVIGVAVDIDAQRMYLRKNGVWLGGSAPGSASGGFNISSVSGSIFAGLGVRNPQYAAVNGSGTANFGATAFAATLPRGFAPWDASSGPAANHPPAAANDSASVEKNLAKVIIPQSNDTDVDGDTLTITATSTPANGTISIASGGASVTYTPNTGFTGTDSFTYTVSDGAGGTATATVNITVALPVVTWSTTDKASNLALSNGNLTATQSQSSQHGMVRATLSRSTGKHYFESTMTAMNVGGGTGVATASASIAPNAFLGSDANGYGYYQTGEIYNGGAAVQNGYPTLVAGDVIGVAVDLDTHKVWWSKNGTWIGNPATGAGGRTIPAGAIFPSVSAYNSGTALTGNFGATTLQRQPPRGFSSWDGNVGPTPNAAPVAVNDTVQAERNVAKVISPQSNDTDADGDTLTITSTSTPANGTISIAAGGASVTYTPNTGYTGSDSFTYTVSDGAGGSATGTVSLTVVVTPVTWNPADKSSSVTLSNGDLSLAAPTSTGGVVRATASRSAGKYYFELTHGTVSAGSNVSGIATAAASVANGAYVGGHSASYGYTSSGNVVTNASVVGTSATYANGDKVGVAVDLDAHRVWWSKNGVWNGNPANGTGGQSFAAAAYFPAASGANGSAITANFGATAFAAPLPRGFAPWDASSGPGANHLPVAVNDTVSAQRNIATVITPQANDTDADGDVLTVTATSTPTHGTISIASGGGSVTYTPATGYTGADSFTYTISDGAGASATGTVNITVTITTQRVFTISPAVSGRTTWNLDVDGPLDLGTAGTWTLTAQTSFQAQTKSWGGGGGGWYAAGGGGGYAGGLVQFQQGVAYRIDVGAGGGGAGVLTGGAPGGGSVAAGESWAGGGGGGFTGLRKSSGLTPVLIAPGGGGSGWGGAGGAGGGSTGESGATFGSYAGGSGGGQSAGGTGAVSGSQYQGGNASSHVAGGGGGGYYGGGAGVGAAPGTNQGGGGGGGSAYADATEVTSTALTGGAGATPGNASDTDRGTAGASATSTNGSPGRFRLQGAVNPNTAPVAVDDTASTTWLASVTVSVLANDSDANADVLTITSTTTPSRGAVAINGAEVTYTPTGSYAGTDTFSYAIADGRGGTSTATVTVSVTAPPNTNPTAANDTISTRANHAKVFDPRINDSDAELDSLTVTFASTPGHGTVSVASNGASVTYTPATDYAGADSFTYTISDGRGGAATATVSMTVLANAAPVAANDNPLATAASPLTFDPRTNDSDAESDPLTITGVGTPSHGTASVTGGGTGLTYTATSGYYGPDTFTYTISDGQGGTASGSINVTVFSNQRVFTISPAVSGRTTWNLDVDGPLDLGTAGTWTLTAQTSFQAQTKSWGGGGGGWYAAGGGGGYAGGLVQFQQGVAYRIDVGAGGGGAGVLTGGAPGGGSVAAGESWAGGGGGGFTGLRKSSGLTPVLIAPGGGGSGWGGAGGAGGGSTGESGATFGSYAGGSGGGQSAGGTGAVSGSQYQGGNASSHVAGGGGGGYYGGGAGVGAAPGTNQGGGGGGGSAYADATEVTSTALTGGAGATPGNASDTDRGTAGASATSSNGSPGRLLVKP